MSELLSDVQHFQLTPYRISIIIKSINRTFIIYLVCFTQELQ